MIIGKILDSFLTRRGRIYIIHFNNSEYSPTMGGQILFNNEILLNIKPYGMGKHNYYKDGILCATNVWSCTFENINAENCIVDIPIGSNLVVLKSID